MKILYGIQGTGNGHIGRAIEIIPHLKKRGDVDILLSGMQSDLELPFHIDYRFNGLYFVFGKKGGIDFMKTYMRSNMIRLLREIKSLPIHQYDLIISDFEPVTAWACYLNKIPCVSLCNQNAALHPKAPRPKKTDHLGKFILEHYAPADQKYGFHFVSFDKTIFTPIIRKQIRELVTMEGEHYTVYLPAYKDDRIIKHLRKFKKVQWHVFSKYTKVKITDGNIRLFPIRQDSFNESIANAKGVLCAAGFGATSEALFLNKKLLVIPQKSQYEQQCNAAVLKSMGVPVMKSLKKKHHDVLEDWLENGKAVKVNYPDQTEMIIDTIIKNNAEFLSQKKNINPENISLSDLQLNI